MRERVTWKVVTAKRPLLLLFLAAVLLLKPLPKLLQFGSFVTSLLRVEFWLLRVTIEAVVAVGREEKGVFDAFDIVSFDELRAHNPSNGDRARIPSNDINAQQRDSVRVSYRTCQETDEEAYEEFFSLAYVIWMY
ncbi:uncharacterized protein LOC110266580 isoform X2 [Arachis ipaensis]|uniref:uncharacterized protein LOC110266580 isoform X2 n=1 Tax=Arachis ipaensis TaxID=130454 RepID=UPI000A2B1AB2|nr:uncharacterized protein LOC110266580 isoform X2 [Arachis ipaensis]